MSNAHGPEESFTVTVPDSSLQTLQQKLTLATFLHQLTDATWDYSVPLADIRRLVARWKDRYDWRAAEKELNDDLPQFKRTISVNGHDTLGIHYVHQKSMMKNAIP